MVTCSGTTANIGIRVYGREGRTDSVHLYHPGAFQRGSVDSFYVASETELGEITKIKLWHDNTGRWISRDGVLDCS